MGVDSKRKTQAARGFSLVEVVLALGILGFAFVSILGMVPMGLSTLRASMDATAQTHMVQALLNEASAGDPSRLVASTRYFDESGQQLDSQTMQWFYKARMALVPMKISEKSGNSSLTGQIFLIGIEARNHPMSDPDWLVTGAFTDSSRNLTIHSVVLQE